MTLKLSSERVERAASDVAHALVQAAVHRALRARDDEHVLAAMQAVVAELRRAAAVGVDMPLRLQVDELRIYYEGRPLDGPSLQAADVLARCDEREIAVLALDARLSRDELNRFFDLLTLRENADAFARGHRAAAMCAFGVRNVKVSLRDPADPSDRSQPLRPTDAALRQYQGLADALQHNHALAHSDQELSLDAAASAVEASMRPIDEPSLLLALSMQDDVDRFTIGHSVGVALLALLVARSIGASSDQLVRVGAAALMHDIGKSKVPQEVLFKQGRLTADEWRAMAEHPRLGAQILIEQHEQVDPHTIGAAFCHHMAPNGTGYPEPMMSIEPSATSKLIRVCDVFEALTAVRPYKRALTPIEAFAVMHRNAGEFDTRWLNTFVRALGLFPNGTRVQLTDGCDAIVVAQTEQPAMPRVQLLNGPDAASGMAGERTIGQTHEGAVTQIARVVTADTDLLLPAFDAMSTTGAATPLPESLR
ncbi:MAG: HD domain-containing phosphohydrolase [Planctomycetota bacterium]|nr:HD domain-containing phosphohydrolase [Planctomycetota bacterium]